jgi:hypothetical protein
MESDSGNLERHISQKNTNNNVNGRYIFLPTRLRSIVQSNNELDKFLLDYGFNILPYFGFIIYLLFLLF